MDFHIQRVPHGELDCAAADAHDIPALALFYVDGVPMCWQHFRRMVPIAEPVL